MPYPVSSFKQASTMQIYNTIRMNAPLDIQAGMPELTNIKDFPKVGEAILGAPTVLNYFCSELVNRIAAVYLKSMTFNNPYRDLKKGFLDFGETVEEIWRGIAKVQVYNPEAAYKREFQRNPPDIRTTFHVINWRVQYPLTVSREMLRTAFTSPDALENFINEVIDSVYAADQYDEFLLFKYMLIKAASHGKMSPVNGDYSGEVKTAAKAFRATSNNFTFPSDKFNEAGVLNTTPRDRQLIFMDSAFNAEFDVDVLAAAFNMDKADFMGRLVLIDSFDSFDNTRFREIIDESNYIEEVTAAELSAMGDVVAMLIDADWFQVYDQLFEFANNYLGSNLEWQYWLHSHKIVSHSPYHNAVVFLDTATAPTAPETLTLEVVNKTMTANGTTLGLQFEIDGTTWTDSAKLVQTKDEADKLIAIDPSGFVTIPSAATASSITLKATCYGQEYTATTAITASSAVGDTVTFAQGPGDDPEDPVGPDDPDGPDDPPGPDDPVTQSLEAMTVPQLKDYAKANNIALNGATRKADILDAINA